MQLSRVEVTRFQIGRVSGTLASSALSPELVILMKREISRRWPTSSREVRRPFCSVRSRW
jgi:hypothetical protein